MRTLVPWEELQARLVHLGVLAEELPEFVGRPVGAWLFREIAHEAEIVTESPPRTWRRQRRPG